MPWHDMTSTRPAAFTMRKMMMTSKERVLATFAGHIPDRVPIDYSANPGIDAKLKTHFGLAENDQSGLQDALGVDFRSAGAPYVGPRLHEDIPERGVKVDNWGIHRRWIEHESGGYWDFCDFPLQNADADVIASWPIPDPDQHDYSTVFKQCQRDKDYAVCLHCFGDLINGNGMLRGMEQTLIDLITDDPAGLLLADRRFAVQTEVAQRTLEAAQGGIDILWLGEDLGTQDRPMISMEIFKKHFRPRYQKLVDLGKSFGTQVMIHTCGSSSWAYEEFIDMGIDAVDTLQGYVTRLLEKDLRGAPCLPRMHQHGRSRSLRHRRRNHRRLPPNAGHHDARRRLLLCADTRLTGQFLHGECRGHVRDRKGIRNLLMGEKGKTDL